MANLKGGGVGPGALRRSGALFAVSETSGMLQMLIGGETLGLRVPTPQMSSTMFGTPFRSGIWGGDGRLTLFVQGPYSWSGGVMATPTFCRS
jgi:hypothetical protein